MVYSACPNCSYEGKGKDKNLKKRRKTQTPSSTKS